jgi:Rod binding domain-containing protein
MSIPLGNTLGPTSPEKAKALASDPAQQAREEAKLREAAQQFEGLFLAQMWKEMRKTVEKTGFMSGGFGEDMFQSMMDQAYADQAAATGAMGLTDLLVQQMGGKNQARPGANLSAYGMGSSAPAGFKMPVEGDVSSSFGPRLHPIKQVEAQHNGLDLAAEKGAPVKATKGGEVIFAGSKEGYGNLVEIRHIGGYTSRYAHLDQVSVRPGQNVRTGDAIGAVGSSGMSTGPHLHFEIRDPSGQPTNPMKLVSGGLNKVS